jgi:apolipoprotein N-acyltransferase
MKKSFANAFMLTLLVSAVAALAFELLSKSFGAGNVYVTCLLSIPLLVFYIGLRSRFSDKKSKHGTWKTSGQIHTRNRVVKKSN